MTEWFEDESFWIDLYPFLFSEERMAVAGDEVDGILTLVPHRGRDALDLCCGPGRHAVPLARRGLNVTGVDRTRSLLDRARRAADAVPVSIEWIECDAREFVRPESFDLAINMFTSIGHFDDADDDRRVLRNVHRSLRPGGAFLLEMAGREIVAEGFQPTRSVEGPDGALLVERHEVIDDWSRIRNTWTLIRDGAIKTFRFRNRIYSGTELRDRLGEVGFTRVRLFGDLDGNPYGPGASRLVAVAVKTG